MFQSGWALLNVSKAADTLSSRHVKIVRGVLAREPTRAPREVT
jgi:hypothetical protein